MSPDDVPTSVTKLVYTCPLSISKAVSQNQVAELFAHYWPAIEEHFREQIAQEIEKRGLMSVTDEDAVSVRLLEEAALIARTGDPFAAFK